MSILPGGTWDTHCHIFPDGFSAIEGKSLPPGGGAMEDYRELCGRLGIAHPVFVQSNAYGLDNGALVQTLEHWGSGASAVAAVAPGTPVRELERLHAAGVRGARVMDLGGGAVPIADVGAVVAMVRPLGWTTIVQIDGSQILDHMDRLEALEGNWVLDHFGKFLASAPTNDELDAVKRLMDGGCHVKFAAPYESSTSGEPDFTDVARTARTLLGHRPDRIVWGSNWPHILNAPDDKPDDLALARTVVGWIPQQHRHTILVDTPARLFGADIPGA